MKIEEIIKIKTSDALQSLYNSSVDIASIQITKTKKEFEGNFTLVVFPFLKISKKSPELTAQDIGQNLLQNVPEIEKFNVVKGFLNISLSNKFWVDFLNNTLSENSFGIKPVDNNQAPVLVEFSSPNTNKPLHLGHIRNNLLGWSVCEILKANGKNVVRVNLINDRGIHICKSMLAWQRWGNNNTPEKANKKGDKLVGDYYVLFDKENKKEIEQLKQSGLSEEEAQKKTKLLEEAQVMLKKWEEGDKTVISLWEQMNSWVYKGFEETYNKMGIRFDRVYYESQTYKSGKEIIQKGIENKIIIKKEDGSAWIDLTVDGLDEKLLLRADGTSVYITQDIGTAVQRYAEYAPEKQIYVVGNEQNYHFQVLALVLTKLGYHWAKDIFHLSYGMVELPEGKMKSREGTVVDADDLMEEMTLAAREISKELGKLDDLSKEDAEKIIQTIAMGALKYFILKVDPKKNMLFDPKESIDFNGNTGPFIQYTYTRIQSVLRKAVEAGIPLNDKIAEHITDIEKEKEIIHLLYEFPDIVEEAGKAFSPALIANYTYELAKSYNQFYHDFPILKEEKKDIKNLRLAVSQLSGKVIKTAMALLGISVPEKM